jgi:type VI secretion system protein
MRNAVLHALPRKPGAARAKNLTVCLALGLTMGLTGCSWFGPTKTALREVTVIAQNKANQGNATALELVFVYDAASALALPRTGPDWFHHRDDLKVDFGPKIETVPMEIPGHQAVDPVPMPIRYKKALVVYCYVNFVAPAGQRVADLTQYKRVVITLAPNTVTYDGTP